MSEYHKIDSIYKRDPSGKKMLFGEFSRDEFEYLRDVPWVWTEKIDGTNVRVIWDGQSVRFGGKTDNAQMPVQLLECLQALFTAELMAQAMKGPAVLYGEGYGVKIQSGGWYRQDTGFILFDVAAESGTWLDRPTVAEIGIAIGLDVVPVVGYGPISEACNFVKEKPPSHIAAVEKRPMEGLVMRPEFELLDRMGHRIITKIKLKDFA